MFDFVTYQYVNLPQIGMLGVNWLAILLGAMVVAVQRPAGQRLMSRSYYYQRIGTATFLLACTQVLWFLYVPALMHGVSILLVVSDLTFSVLYGGYVFQISQDRSRDGYGTAGRAWMGLVPLINLALVFKPSQHATIAPRSGSAITVGLIAMFLARAVAQGVMPGLEQHMAEEGAEAAAHDRLLAFNIRGDAEAALDGLIAAEAAPTAVDTNLMLTAVTRSGLQVTYDFTLDQPGADSLAPEYRTAVKARFCDSLMPYLTAGVIVTLHYRLTNGTELDRIPLSLHECTT